MYLTHSREDHFFCLVIKGKTQCRIFLEQFMNSYTYLVLIAA